MNAVGIDVSKGKSTVAVMRPFGEIVISPFEVMHTESELKGLAEKLLALPGETKIVMEYTGNYYTSIANYLCKAGLFVSVVNAILIHDYKNNSLRRVKTDKKDALKLANYAIDSWVDLVKFHVEDEARTMLKSYYRQYEQYSKIHTMMNNNLIALLDSTYPNVNTLFSGNTNIDGREKWIDYVIKYPHKDMVAKKGIKSFKKSYSTWCQKNGYRYSEKKAEELYEQAKEISCNLSDDVYSRSMIITAANQLQELNKSLAKLKKEMNEIASMLPEYSVVMSMYGVGEVLGPQLMAEIGNISRYHSKKALVAYAGIDPQPYQSGTINVKSCKMSKRGSSSLRHTLFVVMQIYIKNAPADEPIYQFLMKKKSEGKHYKVYMMAGANKFLRQYYAIVSNYINSLN